LRQSPKGAKHTIEHEPQWLGSESVFTHVVSHSVVGATHAQRPALQWCSPVHAIPQLPQLASSVARLTHAAAQATLGAGQTLTHAPELHAA
jgi:hypothetical protein